MPASAEVPMVGACLTAWSLRCARGGAEPHVTGRDGDCVTWSNGWQFGAFGKGKTK